MRQRGGRADRRRVTGGGWRAADRRQKEKSLFPSRFCSSSLRTEEGGETRGEGGARRLERERTRLGGRAQQPGKRNNLRAVLTFLV